MALDAVSNFTNVTVSTTYGSGDTSIVLSSGQGALLPAVSFNVVWYCSSLYSNPARQTATSHLSCRWNPRGGGWDFSCTCSQFVTPEKVLLPVGQPAESIHWQRWPYLHSLYGVARDYRQRPKKMAQYSQFWNCGGDLNRRNLTQ